MGKHTTPPASGQKQADGPGSDPSADLQLVLQATRKSLIDAQLTILELNDTILQRETEKTDALDLLSGMQRLLDERNGHIVELDRVLNEQIKRLREELTVEKSARDQIIQDLVVKLDQANREIGSTHELAAGYARDLAVSQDAHRATQGTLQATVARLDTTRLELETTAARLQATADELASTRTEREALIVRLTAMRNSWSWRLTRPLRWLRSLIS